MPGHRSATSAGPWPTDFEPEDGVQALAEHLMRNKMFSQATGPG